MKILAGAVVRQHPEILAAHIKAMKWQEVSDDIQVDLVYVNDLDPDDPTYFESAGVLMDDPDIHALLTDLKERPAGAEYVVGEDTHHWNIATFQHLAQYKQRLLDYAKDHQYDAVWLVDTDLLPDPWTLQSLIDNNVPIVSACFWTQWNPSSPSLPQVWQRHPYHLDSVKMSEHEFFQRLNSRELFNVGGLGACTLIKTEVLDRVKYCPFIECLPTEGMWQGEDRHFCVYAQRNHIPLMVDAWPDVYHVYRHSYIPGIPSALEDLQSRSLPSADIGDFVAFTLEELESPNLAGMVLHIRGRLGQLKLLPELEIDLQDLAPGQDIITKVSFPVWYESEQVRGQTRLFRLKLLAVKPYLPHVGLPTAVSSFADRYYSPSQLRSMESVKISRSIHNEHNHPVTPDSSRRDGTNDRLSEWSISGAEHRPTDIMGSELSDTS